MLGFLAYQGSVTRSEIGAYDHEDDAARMTGRESGPSWGFQQIPILSPAHEPRFQGLDLRVLRLSPSLERRDHSVLRRLTHLPPADQRGLTLDPRQQLRRRLPSRRHLLGSGLHDPGTYTPSGTYNTSHATP